MLFCTSLPPLAPINAQFALLLGLASIIPEVALPSPFNEPHFFSFYDSFIHNITVIPDPFPETVIKNGDKLHVFQWKPECLNFTPSGFLVFCCQLLNHVVCRGIECSLDWNITDAKGEAYFRCHFNFFIEITLQFSGVCNLGYVAMWLVNSANPELHRKAR